MAGEPNTVSWETFFAELFRDYLAESDEVATAVPPEATLRKVIGDNTTEQTRPLLVVMAAEEERPHSEVAVMGVTCELRYIVPAEAAVGQEMIQGTAPELVGQWILAISRRLKDVAAWHQWIAHLPEARRTGWRVLKSPRLDPNTEERDEGDGTATKVVLVKLRVWVP